MLYSTGWITILLLSLNVSLAGCKVDMLAGETVLVASRNLIQFAVSRNASRSRGPGPMTIGDGETLQRRFNFCPLC